MCLIPENDPNQKIFETIKSIFESLFGNKKAEGRK